MNIQFFSFFAKDKIQMLTTSCRILTLIYPSFLKSFGLYQKSKKCKELHEIEKYLEVQLWTQEGRNEDTGVQIERRMPPLVWKVDGLAWLEGTLKEFYCLSNF